MDYDNLLTVLKHADNEGRFWDKNAPVCGEKGILKYIIIIRLYGLVTIR